MFLQKHFSKIAAGISGAIALVVPAMSFAAYSDGLTLPAGTTTSFTDAIYTYLYVPLTATLFQAQVIQILVVLVAVALILGVAYMMVRGFRLRA